MLEFGITVFILLAVGYWATLWIMGRRDDVLHGEFVKSEGGREPAATAPAVVFPSRPVSARRSAPPAAKAPVKTEPAANAEALESLLVSIKQELKNAAKI